MKGKNQMKRGTSVITIGMGALVVLAIILPPLLLELLFRAIKNYHGW